MSSQPKDKKSKEKVIWFGYGTYDNSPVPQLNSGMVRDPNIFKPLLQWLGLIEKDPPPSSEPPKLK